VITTECRCGCVFVSFDGADSCPDCCESRDPLVCIECGTKLLEAVPKGLCGICDEDWVPVLAA
jgi:hypothetical protein